MKTKAKIDYSYVGLTLQLTHTLGNIDVITDYFVNVHLNKEGKPYIELVDYDTKGIKYMGIEIKQYADIQKFKQFHKDMGVDIQGQINNIEVKPLLEKSLPLKDIEVLLTKLK